jgi:RNA ligase
MKIGNFNLDINHISQFNELLKSKEELKLKKELIGDVEFTSICYMIALPNTFDSFLSRECRGSLFDSSGKIISRPFHKFFNIGEKEFTQPHLLKEIIGYKEKVDGSLAVPVLVKNKIIWKTKKSFYSDVAKYINKFYYPEDPLEDIYNPDKKCSPNDTKLDWTIRDLISENKTPLFEYVSINNRVVIKHFKEELIYLNTRDNVHGYYSSMSHFLDDKFNLEVFINDTIKKEEIEGYVLYDDNDFYKLKTKWYVDRHKAMDMISVRDLIDIILQDKLDDIISILNNLNCIERIKIYQKYSEEVLKYMIYFETLAKEKLLYYDTFDLKKYASNIQTENPPMKSLLFAMKRKDNYELTLKKIIGNYFKEKYKGKVIKFNDE